MTVGVCPKPETLAAFACGDLPDEELAAVAGHIGICATCCRVLQQVPEDTLAGLARAAAAAPGTVHSPGVPKPLLPAALNKTAGQIPEGFANHPRYRIIGEVGAGGMGTVYKAHDNAMDRIVALKVVSPHLTAKVSALARFRKEVRAAAQLEHPNIIRAYDTGEAGGAQFLVMEFIEGVSFDRLVAKRGPLSVNLASTLIRQAALGLQHAADKGMTHRDIKPQNLMVTRKGQVKILDFGLARFAHPDEEEETTPAKRLPFGAGKVVQNAGLTNPNLLMGTPDYLSPEQAKNSHEVDPRSDIYSLGCTLYFLLTGKPPFVDAPTLIDKLLAHTNDEPASVRMQRFEVTAELADVLAKMMAKKPEDRYQSAKEAADALFPHTRSTASEPVFEIVEPVMAPASAPVTEQAFDTSPVPDAKTLTDVPRPKKHKKPRKRASWWQRRKRLVLGGAAAMVAVVAAIIVVSSLGKLLTTNAKETPADPHAIAKGNPPLVQGKGEKEDKSDKGDKVNKGDKGNPPTVITAPKGGLKVLCVIPSDGVWLHDYADVRARLESKGVTVVTASTNGGSSRAHPDLPGPAVPIDKFFTATMDVSEYSALIFVGHNADEYIFPYGRGSVPATKVIQRMQKAGKPVAAIGLGQVVLAGHGVLRGKRAADCEPLRRRYPYLTNDKFGITWDPPGVTTDRSDSTKVVITASGGRESVQFADTILKVIEGK